MAVRPDISELANFADETWWAKCRRIFPRDGPAVATRKRGQHIHDINGSLLELPPLDFATDLELFVAKGVPYRGEDAGKARY